VLGTMFLLCLVNLSPVLLSDTTSRAGAYYMAEVRVIDGDTLEATLVLGLGVSLEGVRIRLLGVDTPEKGEEGYEQALEYMLIRMVLCAERILVTNGKTDSYGRVLGIVMCGETDINEELINMGYEKGRKRDI
jgi:endonuclease YncB( thermonuclease family)